MSETLFRKETSHLKYRAVHIDLKGCVPPLERLLRHLEIYAAARFNAVLIEWEDMFPWSDTSLRSSDCYSEEDIRKIRAKCHELGLEIIPLVQSLGHMENILFRPQYEDLQEIPGDRCCLHPLNPGSSALVRRFCDDILRLLPDLHFFHLGGDEASTFGKGQGEAEFLAAHSKADLYLNYMLPLLGHLKAKGVRPMLWADMMADWPEEQVRTIAPEADLVAWGYQGKVSEFRPSASRERLQFYCDCGVRLWGGCAFKGADGYNAELPNLDARIENSLDWVRSSQAVPMQGIIATGWSRYSTTRPQCEILEGALQSLIVTGALLFNGDFQDSDKDAALDFLQELGEKDRFEQFSKLLQKMKDLQGGHWFVFQQLTATVHSRRNPRFQKTDWYTQTFLKQLTDLLKKFQDLKPEFTALADGILMSRCAEDYFMEREQLFEENLNYARQLARIQ